MKTYDCSIYVRYGYGTISIEAENEDDAYDKVFDFIDQKMKESELTIEYDIEIDGDDDDDEWEE